MVANKHIGKIIVAVMAAAALLCLAAVACSGKLTEAMGGKGVTMEYESKLFNTDEIIDIDIQMDADEWEKMLAGAMSEEYYACDVVINGQKFYNVAIRPKGNTSLSAIVSDPDSDRYSLKLEFGHYVDGQTCWGLDKLILNNNYADATNMKEAVIYDMYQYIGADASLYNYAKISLNGDYMGVYLALEAVEQSFMLRNFGTQDGELYKPDSMEMGGGDRKTSSGGGFGGGMPDMGGFDFGNMPDMGGSASGNRPGRGNSGSGNRPGRGDSESGNTPDMGGFDPGSMPDMGGFGGGMPDMGGFDPGSMPDMGDFDPENMPDMGGFGGGMPDMGSFDPDSLPAGGETPAAEEGSDTEGSDTESSERQRPSGGGPGGGFSMGGNGGANLNYSDDDLDSYSTIWEGSITDTSKGDHRRVVTALKNISEGTDLETYLDVDNILKYMAVHTFAVNQDSLSGSMSHNYYLYEYNGQLNMFPWDYNLSFGGMSMGQSADATEMVNDAIDTPFSGTQFFNALLENEEYLERYHAYLQQLVDEYVNGGRFDEVYSRIRSQIDELVETDPTAFYSGDEYDVAAELLYETVKLRAESIDGQLAGTIPSTDEGQRADSSALVDASHIDVHDMGQFNMGGFVSRDSDEEASGEEGEKTDAQAASGNRRRGKMGFVQRSSDSTDSTGSENGRPDFGGFSGGMPDMGNFDFGNMPDMGGFTPGGISSQAWGKNLLIFGICLGGMLLALLGAVLYRRRPFGKKAKS